MPRTTPALVPSLPATPVASSHVDIAAPVRAWLVDGAAQYRGRGTVLRALMLAMVCARPVNVLLTGAPGTAKTALGTAVAGCLGARFLGVTLSPWTEAAELLGAVDIKALQAGELRRATGKRPTLLDADMALLDELPRATSGIRAMCLSALADRITPTGDIVPAHVIVAAANTRLTSEDDRALVDRFALRVDVPRLADPTDLGAVMFREVTVGTTAPTRAPLAPLDPALLAALRAQSDAATFPVDVADALRSLAMTLRTPSPSGGAYPDVSERRWIIITRILQASATLAGRASVDWSDLTDTLPLCIDDGAESRTVLANAITAAIPKWVSALGDIARACDLVIARARRVAAGGEVQGIEPMRVGDGDADAVYETELDALVAPLKSYGADVVERATTKIEACKEAVDDERATILQAKLDARAAKKGKR